MGTEVEVMDGVWMGLEKLELDEDGRPLSSGQQQRGLWTAVFQHVCLSSP